MKKYLVFAATVIMLTGCGKVIKEEKNLSVPNSTAETVRESAPTAGEDSAEVTVTTTAAPVTTTAAATTTTAEKKEDRSEEITLTYLNTAEVYSKLTVGELVTETNAEILNGDELVDTDELGSKELAIKLGYEGGEYEKTAVYTVADTTAPTVLNVEDNITLAVGSYFDPDEHISYGDNYDPLPTLSWSGTVDTETVGSYPIVLSITDASGNQTDRTATVFVSDYVPSYTDDLVRIPFEDFTAQYAGDGRSFGIDISRWQGAVDFEAVKNAGCSFVILRIGYSTGGGAQPDEWFETNYANAKAAGLRVGVYFYSEDTDEEMLRANARWIAETLNSEALDFPVAFDWEDFARYQKYGMSIHALNQLYEDFSQELESLGYSSMLYGSKNFMELFWENRNHRPVWVAHYVDETTYEGDYIMWQRCGWGRIDGINGDVDLDILYE